MSYITLFLAWLQMQGSGLTGNAWGYEFWTRVVGMNTWLFSASWWVWGVVVILWLLGGFLFLRGGGSISELFSCAGCLGVILLIFPLGAWINLTESKGILASMSPDLGITNVMNFWISLGLFLFFGIF